MVLATVPAAPPARKNHRATSWPAPLPATGPHPRGPASNCGPRVGAAPRRAAGPEDPPGDLLAGADLGDRAVPARVQVDLQGLLQRVDAGGHAVPPRRGRAGPRARR